MGSILSTLWHVDVEPTVTCVDQEKERAVRSLQVMARKMLLKHNTDSLDTLD